MYRSAETGIWSDPKFKALSREGKLLFFYYFTNPHTHLSGIYYLPKILVAHEVGLSESEVNVARAELITKHLVQVDDEAEVVLVPRMYRYQQPNPNGKHLKSVAAHLATLHNHAFIRCFLDQYAEYDIPYRYPIDRVSEVSGTQNQNQNQIQEQNQNQNRVEPRSDDRPAEPQKRTRKVSGDHQAFIEHFTAGWHQTFGRDYHFQNAKDGSAVGRILQAAGSLAGANRIADDFLADRYRFISENGHTIAILASQINRYLAGAHNPSSAESDNGFVRAEVTPEIMDLVKKAGA